MPEDCQLGSKQRVVYCVAVDDDDEYMYCGTGSGDLLRIRVAKRMFVVRVCQCIVKSTRSWLFEALPWMS